MGLSRVELFAAIRRDRRLDAGLSQRALAEKYGVHRRTVRQALESAVPPPRKEPVVRRSVLDPAKDWIDEMLREDLTAPRKQKHTARRIYQRLAQKHGFDEVSYSTVSDYVAVRRPEIETEAREGHRQLVGMVPQVHLPGEEAEVDFADVWVRLAGTVTKCHLFTLRLSYSGKAVHFPPARESRPGRRRRGPGRRPELPRVRLGSCWWAVGRGQHSAVRALPTEQHL
ncbi:hypothetical protein [Streptomyces sp. NPDC031705]|uniref:hypothetical protein n=1 Tax=Streptomyces sp. NPDC031705 TaxID=3155729 RepID=UPI0033D3F01D